ncbi:hypothetical protein [Paenarthrobacter sp. 2TAF44]|uniref:hypothetical protein n=1 Tax=Paenarthrobacter sp. 2TAF44 TaxID=3233018 RepID=UPI003F946A74
MNEKSEGSLGRRITDFLGLTDSPGTRARIVEKTTPLELLVRAIIISALPIGAVIVYITDPEFALLVLVICFVLLAARFWFRWFRYRSQ